MIIAIDGPAASGKGTIAKQIASGLRAASPRHRAASTAPSPRRCSMPAVRPTMRRARSTPRSRSTPTQFDEIALKAQVITEAASVVAAIPEVRQALMNYQREFAVRPPGAVLDGRDIGTVIAPGADVKMFVVATPEVRAARRVLEMRGAGRAGRRGRGSGRPVAPRRARFAAQRRPAQGRSRRALARYHAFGYRRRIPGRRRYHRGRPNGPKAQLTALSSLEVQPVRCFACAAPDLALSRSYGLGPNRRRCRRLPRVRDRFIHGGPECSWLKLLPPRRRAKTSPA